MAVYSICLDGGRMPFFSAGIDLFRMGKTEARYAMMRHQMETDANCTIVNVTGFGKAVNIDFEDVLVSADVMYHAMQSAWMKLDRNPYTEQLHRNVRQGCMISAPSKPLLTLAHFQ